ncbi:MAG: LysM peptidoglycan-binding domain-containing protein [Anaerolineae bacterium]|jgi:LysM repeat protein
MSKRQYLPLALGLAAVLMLVVGCTMRAAPDVTPTPSDQDQTQWGMETMAAQTAGTATAEAAADTPEPTEPAATTVPEPTQAPTVEPTVEPTQAPTQEPTEAPTTQPSGERVHVVRRGENLYRIALQYGMSYPDLAAYNNIVNPHNIHVGQQIRIPSSAGTGSSTQPQPSGGRVHIVQPGENLFRIALQYNMSYHYLASYNNISNPNSIYVGQRIRIP